MGGFFGCVLSGESGGEGAERVCVRDVFYGTDYHSHLGTSTGGMAIWNGKYFDLKIRDISVRPFRSAMALEKDARGRLAIGSISDYAPQPLGFNLKFGNVSIAHVGRMRNIDGLVKKLSYTGALSTMSHDGVNPIEVVANLTNQGRDIADGIEIVQNEVGGSCSVLVATSDAIYIGRDMFGRTPVSIGKRDGAYAVALENASFANRGFSQISELGPGEIGRLGPEGYEVLKKAEDKSQICTFLWVYYGFPASDFNNVSVELFRNFNGRNHARQNFSDRNLADYVAAFPDSGVGHAVGYASELGLDCLRPLMKYAQTWQRSFMPPDQEEREHVAQMKIITVPALIQGKRILLTEDSIVRGTQLIARTKLLKERGAKSIHIRPSCPPLVFPCEFLNFSRSKGAFELAARRAIKHIEGKEGLNEEDLRKYVVEGSSEYLAMVDQIRQAIPHLDTLDYQRLPVMINSIGLPKERLCTHCWDGNSYCVGCPKNSFTTDNK